MLNRDVLCVLRNGNDTIRRMHTPAFLVINMLIGMPGGTIKFSCMDVHHQGFPRYAPCFDPCTKRKPVVRVDEVVCFFASDHAGVKTIPAHFIEKIEPIEFTLGGRSKIFFVKLFGNIRMNERVLTAKFDVLNIRKKDVEEIMIQSFEFLWKDEGDIDV